MLLETGCGACGARSHGDGEPGENVIIGWWNKRRHWWTSRSRGWSTRGGFHSGWWWWSSSSSSSSQLVFDDPRGRSGVGFVAQQMHTLGIE